MSNFIASLFLNSFGYHCSNWGWARFRDGQLVDASPAVRNAYGLRVAHFVQTGF